ncbi:hypothetical protein IRI77_13385 [Paludibaculum fermentans]|uniref:MacB-like periplasmic core domain-containing protein n=1 Tax=Paludibaculum fermentans TaxID=1473598 RepID=A0A7S7SNG3_PALFE|nr:hypothetical protein IRI77_13385 [Paludibaculum fermentans]
MLEGRPIDERAVAAGAKVEVGNEDFAAKYFEGANEVGRHFYRGTAGPEMEFEIVGVARNARYPSLKDELSPVAYVPSTHSPNSMGHLTFQLRAAGDPPMLANAVRAVVRQADSRVALAGVRTQDKIVDRAIGQERTFVEWCMVFAAVAVGIAGVGLNGGCKRVCTYCEMCRRVSPGGRTGAVVGRAARDDSLEAGKEMGHPRRAPAHSNLIRDSVLIIRIASGQAIGHPRLSRADARESEAGRSILVMFPAPSSQSLLRQTR